MADDKKTIYYLVSSAIVDDDNKCYICMENIQQVFCNTCHKNPCCFDCYIKIALNNKIKHECPLCNGPWYKLLFMGSDEQWKDESIKLGKIMTKETPKYFEKWIKSYIKMVSNSTTDKDIPIIINTIINTYFDEIKSLSFLSVDLIEKLLIISDKLNGIPKAYALKNCLVSMCSCPFAINIKLGGCGLCYHGNFGEVPSLDRYIKLLIYNKECLRNRNAIY